MLEVELKSVVDDVDRCRAAVERAGAKLVFAGRLEDRRWDTPDRAMLAKDHVLRVRVYRGAGRPGRSSSGRADAPGRHLQAPRGARHVGLRPGVSLRDAGPTRLRGQHRDRPGDRAVRPRRHDGPIRALSTHGRSRRGRGGAEQIERAIAVLGLAREGFTTDRLPDFVRRYEERTGGRAAISDADLAGDGSFDVSNA